MIKDNQPYVLEYNVRMGDPECQSISMRMNFDLYDYLVACVDGNLSSLPPISWKKAICCVCCIGVRRISKLIYKKMKKS